MSNPYTITVTSVTKDSPGAGQLTIVATYDQATAYTQSAQRTTVPNFPVSSFSRMIQLTETALFCLRNGSANAVALLVASFAKIAVALESTLTYAPIFTANPAVATATFASATLTSDNTNVSNNDTVVIGSKTYTFKTTLTPTEGEVLISVTNADGSLLNLINAINHTGTPNTDYKCAAANTQVWAEAAVAAHKAKIHALAIGTAPNAYATTTAAAHLSWGGSVMAGGTAAPTFAVTINSELSGSTYQWQYSADNVSWVNCSGTPVNGTTYSNYTTATLTATPAATGPGVPGTGQNGYYHRCVATNSLGSTNSAPARLFLNLA